MNRISRAVTAVASAGLAVGLSAVPASAAPHPLTGASVARPAGLAPNVYSSYKSGYVAHGNGRVFDRVAATFPAPLTNTRNGTTSWRVYVQLATGGHEFDAGIIAVGPDTYAAEYRIDGSPTVMTLTPQIQPGDLLTAVVLFDAAGDRALDFRVTDHTTHASVTIPDVVKPVSGPILFASVLAHPNPPSGCGGINPIATDCLNSRLVAFTGVQFTANNGQQGNLTHTFQVAKIVQTDTGSADGDLYSSPNSPWNGGRNFGDYMRP